MLSVWRRALSQGTPNMDVPDPTTLLGSSVDAFRQHVDSGKVHATQDPRGRISISASVTYTPEGYVEEDLPDAETMARMWAELKSLQEKLEKSRAEEARLQAELEAAEKALDYTKSEVANLWRVMTTRNLRHAARKASEVSHETARVLNLAEQRTRIRSKVADVREIARRRRWRWMGLVG